ncbi:hypothetical protein, partial [Azospirillum brasilense]|uniref:hypothetical protein n=1 Tax=Azospirillum brasilense TaxID=192 RepID=UPI00196244EA
MTGQTTRRNPSFSAFHIAETALFPARIHNKEDRAVAGAASHFGENTTAKKTDQPLKTLSMVEPRLAGLSA